MTKPILDRLNARIAVEPALADLDTLFADLADARDAIIAGNAGVKPSQPAVSTEAIDEVRTLLIDAKERLSVNAIGAVATFIDSALRLLEPIEYDPHEPHIHSSEVSDGLDKALTDELADRPKDIMK